MVEASGLLAPTPGAPLPSATKAGWIVFGDAQTGQLDKANLDKAGVRGILRACASWQARAVEDAKRRHWWQFGRLRPASPPSAPHTP